MRGGVEREGERERDGAVRVSRHEGRVEFVCVLMNIRVIAVLPSRLLVVRPAMTFARNCMVAGKKVAERVSFRNKRKLREGDHTITAHSETHQSDNFDSFAADCVYAAGGRKIVLLSPWASEHNSGIQLGNLSSEDC